jgi:competence protein ComEA
MAMPVQPISVMAPPSAGAVPVVTGEALELHIRSNGTATLNRGLISTSQRLVLGIPLDINVISESDLDKVPGIGPALAKRIVLYRQNNGGKMLINDLLMVEGIGEKKFNALRKFF